MALTRESFMKVIERRRVNCPELGQTLGGTAAAAGETKAASDVRRQTPCRKGPKNACNKIDRDPKTSLHT